MYKYIQMVYKLHKNNLIFETKDTLIVLNKTSSDVSIVIYREIWYKLEFIISYTRDKILYSPCNINLSLGQNIKKYQSALNFIETNEPIS